MTHFRLLFPDRLSERHSSREAAEASVQVHRQYGDEPAIVVVPGHYVGPQKYGDVGTVDGVPLAKAEN